MIDEDKLRFELGIAFNKLPATEITKIFSSDKYWHNKSNSYCEHINNFCHMLRKSYSDDEEFVQIITELCGPRRFGWALANLHDNEMYDYAREKFINIMKERGLNNDDIHDLLACKELPKY